MSILEGKDPMEKLNSTFLTAYKTNLMLWPWVQAANFSLVPLQHRVLVVNVISLGKSYIYYLFYLLVANCRAFRVELRVERYQQQRLRTIISYRFAYSGL